MKAVLLKQTGSIDELEKNLVVEDIPVPVVFENDVLIKIKFALFQIAQQNYKLQ